MKVFIEEDLCDSSDELVSNHSSVDPVDIYVTKDHPSFSTQLAACATRNKWSRSSVNELLFLLQPYRLELPQDARTLLNTPNVVNTFSKCGGDYAYFGIASELKRVFIKQPVVGDIIYLSFNIDGVSLFRSSTKQLWPILASYNNSNIFIVGLYCGNQKPNCVNEFLYDFIREVKDLLLNGLIINDKHYCIELRAFLCDACFTAC